MASAVEADLAQLDVLFAIHRRMDAAIDTREIAGEIGARVREELDYFREAKHAALYARMLAANDEIRVPGTWSELSTRRLLTLDWLEGRKLLEFKGADQSVRDRIAVAMYRAWWQPFSQYGVIHGDPHLGNYTVFGDGEGINLLDYGCIRIFPATFVAGVVDLYRGLLNNEPDRVVHAYEAWGFKGLRKDLIEILNIWARFIFAPVLDDRVRSIADGVDPSKYGRREAFTVHKALKEKGPVKVPREFVFMDRAAIGLGGVFLHLDARLNYHRLFEAALEGFDSAVVAQRQSDAMREVGLISG
jgi:predicted unusual protein kinase regulating ubiquinone biosynthesis (AarF/ABC1/UbiB family)